VRRGFVAVGTSISALILAGALAAATAIAQPTTTTTTNPPAGTTTTTTPLAGTTTVPPTTTGYPPTTTSPTTTTSAPPNPQLLLVTAIATFQLERGAEWSLNWSLLGKSESEVVHDGQSDGTEVATFKGGGATGRISLDLDGKLYVSGDAGGLGDLGFKASAATAEAGHWIRVPRTAAVFASWAAGLTVGSAAYMLDAGGKAVLGPTTTAHGHSVISISQSTKSQGLTINQTDYFEASGPLLPVEVVENIEGLVVRVVYGAWDKSPHAEIHKAAVPFLKSWLAKP